MTEQEAISRIQEHMLVHRLNEPRAVLITEALRMGILALEKQIPKEPSQLLKYTDYFHWECPICHMSYGMATQKVKYCSNCGQAIKWE